MEFVILIEKGLEGFGAYVPDLPGCVAVAATEQEVLTLIREAIALHLEDLRRTGQAVPVPSIRSARVRVA
jgi:predicted RNase H-like HicB family nuclease